MSVPGRKCLTNIHTLYCQPCDRQDQDQEAFGFCQDCDEHLCQSCYEHHKKATPCRHHVLLDKHAMPKIQQNFSTIAPGESGNHDNHDDDLISPCTKHKKTMIKFYCQHHKELLCIECKTQEHNGRPCKVDYIPDISDTVGGSHELKEVVQHMDSLIQESANIKKKYQKQTDNSIESLNKALTEITKYRKEINERIDKLQSQVENKVKSLKQEKAKFLKNIETRCDDVSQSVNILSNNIKQNNLPNDANKLFIDLQVAKLEIKQHETSIKHMLKDDIEVLHFQPNVEISTFLQNQTTLGQLEGHKAKTITKQMSVPATYPILKTEKEQDSKCISDVDIKEEFSLTGRIFVRTKDDKKGSFCSISGITLLTSDLVVITDQFNNCIKSVCIRSQSVIAQRSLDPSPWDVTKVTETQVAVCQPAAQTIQFISARFGKLSIDNSLHVDGKCYGICYYRDKLVVTYDSPPKFEILDMHGTVLTRVAHNVKQLFNKPRYVTVDNSSIYISDLHNQKVFKFNWQGDETGQVKNLGQIQGITVSHRGVLYVCDSQRHKIVALLGDRTVGKIQAKELNRPHNVCWCEDSLTLYVSSGSYSETGNYIFIFKKTKM